MPKEQVHDYDGRRVQVGWWKESGDHVEIATINPLPDAEPQVAPQLGENSNGWFVHLDRTATQKLIRDLKRARNATWGADE